MAHTISFKAQFIQNKIFEHPVLGKVSCESYLETLKECLKRNPTEIQQKSICGDLYQMTNECYTSANVPQLTQWINEKLQDRRQFLEYLRRRRSTLVSILETYSSWNIFNTKKESNTQRAYTSPQYDENMRFIREQEHM